MSGLPKEIQQTMLFTRAVALKEDEEEMRAKANTVRWVDRELENIYLDIADRLSAALNATLSELIDGVHKNTVMYITDEKEFGGR